MLVVSSILWRLQAIWQMVFFAIPVGWLLILSFRSLEDYAVTWELTLDNYQRLALTPSRNAMLNSLYTSLLTAVLVAVLALPFGYCLYALRRQTMRRLVLVLVLVPYFMNAVIRLFGWQVWLSETGILGGLFNLYSLEAIVLGSTSLLLPIGGLLVYVSMFAVEDDWIGAAQNLGATWKEIFLLIEFPFAVPGLVASFAFTFIVAMGDYLAGTLLGGSSFYTLALALQDRMTVNDLPGAAAIGVVLMTSACFVLALAFLVLQLKRRDS